MQTNSNCLSVKSLAELALMTARIGRAIIQHRAEPPADSIRDFWQESRGLIVRWQRRIDEWGIEDDVEMTQLQSLASEIFVTDIVVRVWSTVLLGLDCRSGRVDLTRIARNVVGAFMQVRHSLMSKLLQQPEVMNNAVFDAERLRRRCERWVDLLIGNLSGRSDLFEFAIDIDRAKDFATESTEFEPATGPHPVEHLVAAGLRMAFLGQLSDTPLEDPGFSKLVQSVLSAFPENSFHRDGSLRTNLERRLTSADLRDEPIPSFLTDTLLSSAPAIETIDLNDDLGISFSRLRRRPK